MRSRSSCHDSWPHALPPGLPILAQVLTTYSLLLVPPSPTMQLCTVLVLYAYYRCALHLETWTRPAIYIPVPPGSPAAANPVLLVFRAIAWLHAPPRRALFHLFLFVIFDKWTVHQLRFLLAPFFPVYLTSPT